MSARLEGRVAVITGGANGIGLATTTRFLDEGARVAVWDAIKTADDLVAEACGERDDVLVRRVDIRDAAAVAEAADEVRERWGDPGVLVNNAGINPGRFVVQSFKAYEWEIPQDVHLRGAVHCVGALVDGMIAQGWGRILNTTSALSRDGLPGTAAYSASKAGVEAMTRVWARELGPHGITVNAVSPGFIATRMNVPLGPAFAESFREQTPLGRLGTAEDIAAAHAFLASEEASFITGAVLPVDGGLRV